MIKNNPTDESKSVKVIDLYERYSDKYKVIYEESYYHEHGPNCRLCDPELMIVPCKHGHIFPWGGPRLGAAASKGAIANKLANLPCCKVEQDGDDGINVSFHIQDFDVIAALMKPRRKRRLSPAHRKALVEAGRAHQFPSSPG